MRVMSLRITVVALLGVGLRVVAEDPPRVRVALLGFENRTGDPGEDHWGDTLNRLLQEELEEIGAVRLKSQGEVDRARKDLGIKGTTTVDLEIAKRLGGILEVQRILWGFYTKMGDEWIAFIRVLPVASGVITGEIRSASPDWHAVRDGLVAGILEKLKVELSKEGKEKLGRCLTESAAALETFSRGYEAYGEKEFTQAEKSFRQALSMDPKFSLPRVGLAAVTATQGKLDEGEEEARRVLKKTPEELVAYYVLGASLLHQGKTAEAEKSLTEANRLDPENFDVLLLLEELHRREGHLDQARDCILQAQRVSPLNSELHARLAIIQLSKGNREEAIKEVREAERLNVENINTHLLLGQILEQLGEDAWAAHHIVRLLALARGKRVDPEVVRSMKERLRDLKRNVNVPHVDPLPRALSKDQLREELDKQLSPEELRQVRNPLESTAEMDAWAREIAAGVKEDWRKAHAFFHRLMERTNGEGESGGRTAREVFASWNDPKASFNIEELAKLYVALARGIGLQAFLVHLEEDLTGKKVMYACATAILDGKTFLVDPTYDWFGIPHRHFKLLDDIQAIAHDLSQSRSADRISLRRIAVWLAPEVAWSHSNLAWALFDTGGNWQEIQREVQAAFKLQPENADLYWMQGSVAIHDGETEKARALFERGVALNPKNRNLRYLLAWTLYHGGKLKEARKHMRRLVRPYSPGEHTDWALGKIAEINEKIGFDD